MIVPSSTGTQERRFVRTNMPNQETEKLLTIIEELTRKMEKMERDHAETISSLLETKQPK